jgi:hypothetical protein
MKIIFTIVPPPQGLAEARRGKKVSLHFSLSH